MKNISKITKGITNKTKIVWYKDSYTVKNKGRGATIF